MRGPLIALALSLVLLAGVWAWGLLAYAVDEEAVPRWLRAIWFVALGLLALSLVWAIVHLVRVPGRQVARDDDPVR
jgi:hypothetical protein